MTAAEPTITVNEQARPLAAGATVARLAGDLGLEHRRGVALAVNGAVVPRAQWPSRPLAPGDRILVIQATQGG